MPWQKEFHLSKRSKGCHLITDEVVAQIDEALKDVKKFKLGPEALGNPHLRGSKGKAKDKSVESEGCMYYIKPRCIQFVLRGLHMY